MDDEPKVTVKTVFGKELDLSPFADVDVREIMSPIDQLRIEGRDPAYEYGWLDSKDPMTQYKIQKGIWETVKPDSEKDLVVPGTTDTSDGFLHVRELILVRMPKERWDRLQKAYAFKSLQAQTDVKSQFAEMANRIAKNITPDASAVPRYESTEEVRVGKKAK